VFDPSCLTTRCDESTGKLADEEGVFETPHASPSTSPSDEERTEKPRLPDEEDAVKSEFIEALRDSATMSRTRTTTEGLCWGDAAFFTGIPDKGRLLLTDDQVEAIEDRLEDRPRLGGRLAGPSFPRKLDLLRGLPTGIAVGFCLSHAVTS